MAYFALLVSSCLMKQIFVFTLCVLSLLSAAEPQEAETAWRPIVLTQHMAGRWDVAWHHGCSGLTTPGTAVFTSPTDMSWIHRNYSTGGLETRLINGEGSNLTYIPLLTGVERPKHGDLGSYAYQLCDSSVMTVDTPNRDPFKPLGSLVVTETRVFRGFVSELMGDFFLGRCAGGKNKNYNFFVTTVGEPLGDLETAAGEAGEGGGFFELTRKFQEVKFQFRLPGKVGCAEETLAHPLGHQKRKPSDFKASIYWNDKKKDTLVDEGYEIIAFSRSDYRINSNNANKGFLHSGNAVMMFAGLFMVVRVYTSYRVHRKKLETRQEIMRDVSAEARQLRSGGGGSTATK
jgi:hypothetical protein